MSSLELKIHPPIVMLLAAALMFGLSFLGPTVALSGGVKAVLVLTCFSSAVALVLSAFLTFRRFKTTYHPHNVHKARSLLVTGVFSYSRNPMYLGMVLALLAWGIYLGALTGILGLVFFIIFINRYQILPEERALHATFGDTYTAYCDRVRRWL